MTADVYLKPVPDITPDSAPYWEGLEAHKLMLQACARCGKVRHYPRPMCDACYAMEARWIEAKGTGRVHSWTVTHHAFNIGFKGELPYVLVIVDLEEGVRMQAPLRGVPEKVLRIGLPVRVTFEHPKPDLALPAFIADAT
jgi:uncharacterized protein